MTKTRRWARQQARAGACRQQAGRAGAGRVGRARGACVLGVQGARGRRACVGRAGVAQGARGAQASGARRRAARHGRAERWRARERAAGLAGVRAWAAATRGALAGAHGRRRQGLAGRPAGRPVRVWCAQLGQVGCFGAPDSVFGLVRLGIFPESPNEHCSL